MSDVDARTPAESRSVLVHWTGPGDTNNQGTVHGGTLLKLADEAAALVGIRHARHDVVTAGVDRVTFLAPIAQGELVTLQASLNAVWRTSMEVGVRVTVEALKTGGEPRHTNSAYITVVALDEDGRPVEVPPLRCETDEERRREREAQTRRSNRLAEREALLRERAARGDEPG